MLNIGQVLDGTKIRWYFRNQPMPDSRLRAENIGAFSPLDGKVYLRSYVKGTTFAHAYGLRYFGRPFEPGMGTGDHTSGYPAPGSEFERDIYALARHSSNPLNLDPHRYGELSDMDRWDLERTNAHITQIPLLGNRSLAQIYKQTFGTWPGWGGADPAAAPVIPEPDPVPPPATGTLEAWIEAINELVDDVEKDIDDDSTLTKVVFHAKMIRVEGEDDTLLNAFLRRFLGATR